MKKSQLIDILFSNDEEEVSIVIDGIEYDIDPDVENIPEKFDGFFTATPAAIGLKIKDYEE